MNKLENKDFNFKEFKDILNGSDIAGLEYLYENEIKYYNLFIPRNDYIYKLYIATCSLNCCVEYYESYSQTKCENNFDYDIYTNTRDLLFKELGFDIEKLYS